MPAQDKACQLKSTDIFLGESARCPHARLADTTDLPAKQCSAENDVFGKPRSNQTRGSAPYGTNVNLKVVSATGNLQRKRRRFDTDRLRRLYNSPARTQTMLPQTAFKKK